MHTKLVRYVRVAALSAALGLATPVLAVPIPLDTFLQFSFTDAGVLATGCQPNDPVGDFCVPSSGTPTEFLGAAPWTFVAPVAGAFLTVVDAFVAGEQFEIFDLGVSLGLTSAPVGVGDCGDDPAACLADPNMSRGIFALLAGDHSITITPTLSPGGSGSGYLQVQQIPVPPSLALLAGGLLGLYGWRRAEGRGLMA